jgi:hypothetical protein
MLLVNIGKSRAHLVGRADQQRMICSHLFKNPDARKTVADRLRSRALARTRQAIDEEDVPAREGGLHWGAFPRSECSSVALETQRLEDAVTGWAQYLWLGVSGGGLLREKVGAAYGRRVADRTVA